MTTPGTPPPPPSDRTTVRRGANRAAYGADAVRSVLAAGVIAHVGVATPDGPVVLPMAYGVRGTGLGGELLLHGAVANALLRAGAGVDVCATVTILDGLVLARTPFHNSMNYRSVVVRGTARQITDPDEKTAALRVINDHVVPTWDTSRPPSDVELRRTMVLALPLAESSAKVRSGDPVDDEDDLGGPHWAGVVPIETTFGSPAAADDLADGVATPGAVAAVAGRPVHPR